MFQPYCMHDKLLTLFDTVRPVPITGALEFYANEK